MRKLIPAIVICTMATSFMLASNQTSLAQDSAPPAPPTVARLQADLAIAKTDLQARTQELATANGNLQTRTQELATANGDLQTRTRELATANGNLQTRTQELATANGNLQTRTQELATANGDLRTRTRELATATGDLEDMTVERDELKEENENLDRILEIHVDSRDLVIERLGNDDEGNPLVSERTLSLLGTAPVTTRVLTRLNDPLVNNEVLRRLKHVPESILARETLRAQALQAEADRVQRIQVEIAAQRVREAELLRQHRAHQAEILESATRERREREERLLEEDRQRRLRLVRECREADAARPPE
jgi:alkylhydroperoxidase/carboxymuconolactone decarboxylase family protein YurZ